MHDTGMVRRVDSVGRIVLPVGLRRALDIKIKDPLAIYVEGERLILEKYHEACRLCGETEVKMFELSEGIKVCIGCARTIKENY